MVFIAKNLKAVSLWRVLTVSRGYPSQRERFFCLDRRHLRGQRRGRTDVHGVLAVATGRHHLDQESETPVAVLVDRHLPDHCQSSVYLLLHFSRTAIVCRANVRRHHPRHTAVFRDGTVRDGSHRHGKYSFPNDSIHTYIITKR